MEQHFDIDELAKAAAEGLPRREVLRRIGAALAAGVLGLLPRRAVAADCPPGYTLCGNNTCCPAGSTCCVRTRGDLTGSGYCRPAGYTCCGNLGQACGGTVPTCCVRAWDGFGRCYPADYTCCGDSGTGCGDFSPYFVGGGFPKCCENARSSDGAGVCTVQDWTCCGNTICPPYQLCDQATQSCVYSCPSGTGQCDGYCYNPATQCCTPSGLQQKWPIMNLDACPNRTEHPGHVSSANGCGAAGSTRYPGRFGPVRFTLCCNGHDLCYDTCNSDRIACDNAFGGCLQAACSAIVPLGPHLYAGCVALAAVYYGAVLYAGGDAYNAAQSTACDCC
jgi:hypothetical protein